MKPDWLIKMWIKDDFLIAALYHSLALLTDSVLLKYK